MSDLDKDAALTMAECVVRLQQLRQQNEKWFSVDHRVPDMARVCRQVLCLMKHDCPVVPEVREAWSDLLVHAMNHDDSVFFFFLVESITLGLKLYQHPDIGVSLLTRTDGDSNAATNQG